VSYWSSEPISLFTTSRFPVYSPVAVVASVSMHAVGAWLIFFAVISAPVVNDDTRSPNLELRHIDLHAPAQHSKYAAFYPHPGLPGAAQANQAPDLAHLRNTDPSHQLLVQPDLPLHVEMPKKLAVPAMVLWTPRDLHGPRQILAPHPDKPATADAKPSPESPNREPDLDANGISSTVVSNLDTPLKPSSTVPLRLRNASPSTAPITSITQSQSDPTSAQILSVSDLSADDGPMMLPPINASPSASNSTEATMRATEDSAANSNGAAKDAVNGQSQGSAAYSANATAAANAGQGSGAALSRTLIQHPANGHFGSVVIGSNLDERFPELGTTWRGRIAFTVNLHLGTARTWVLQYSLPQSEVVAANGQYLRIDPPWPVSIVRPNIPTEAFNSDSILVHAFVTPEGRFEDLSLVFPSDFPQSRFVLDSLAQWSFRPAAQSGQPIRVEVLLAIPAQ